MNALQYAGLAGGGTVGFLAAGPAGALVGGVLGVLLGGAGSGGGGGGGGGGGVTEPAPAPSPSPEPKTGLRSRVIDGSTLYPSQFAAKWAGNSSKWKELPSVNPEMAIYQKHQVLDLSGEWQDCMIPCSLKGPDGVTEQPQRDIDWGLTPFERWKVGQAVFIPDSWPG